MSQNADVTRPRCRTAAGACRDAARPPVCAEASHGRSGSPALKVKNLATGETLPDEIPGIFYGGAWSADGTT
ncbi:hypothetical protein, partial [Streptosporangium sp. NPDC048865]|uniref:hypothetical protein n=1 Tax=Streptosporangium sp. NPDC048865 TaxID=3155766 RepID=UPI00342965D3